MTKHKINWPLYPLAYNRNIIAEADKKQQH